MLPPSLQVLLSDRSHPSYRTSFKLSEALKILQDLSSALLYLSTKDVAHNDIKPGNIAYSPRRGTVLFDFGMARSPTSLAISGTPWYLPPEFLHGNCQGFERDIWALGITMIYVIGIIPLPESTPSWLISGVFMIGSPDRKKMESWVESIDCKRKKLCQYVAIAEFELLISEMLHPIPGLRVKAAELQRRAAIINSKCNH